MANAFVTIRSTWNYDCREYRAELSCGHTVTLKHDVPGPDEHRMPNPPLKPGESTYCPDCSKE